MENQDAREIRKIITDILEVDKDNVADGASLRDDLGADSTDMVHIIMMVEKRYDLVIPENDVEEIETVGDLIAYKEQKMKSK